VKKDCIFSESKMQERGEPDAGRELQPIIGTCASLGGKVQERAPGEKEYIARLLNALIQKRTNFTVLGVPCDVWRRGGKYFPV